MITEQLRRLIAALPLDEHRADSPTLGDLRCAIQSVGDGVQITLPIPCAMQHDALRARLAEFAPETVFTLVQKIPAHLAQAGVSVLPHVKNVIAIASGKGGVGKSTTAVNLALATARLGARVGILDADIYGPSVPALMGLSAHGKPALNEQGQMIAPHNYGVAVNSIGFLLEADNPVAWRGAMVSQALQQLFFQTAWNEAGAPLDYLFVDMPPGTGDVQLTLSQKIPVTAAVIVTTPQDLALLDARKGLALFEKTHIKVLGIVENMASHVCSQCGHTEAIFGAGQLGGAAQMSQDFHTHMLGQLPLALPIRTSSDAGKPIVIDQPDSPHARHYIAIAERITHAVANLPKDLSHKITITQG